MSQIFDLGPLGLPLFEVQDLPQLDGKYEIRYHQLALNTKPLRRAPTKSSLGLGFNLTFLSHFTSLPFLLPVVNVDSRCLKVKVFPKGRFLAR